MNKQRLLNVDFSTEPMTLGEARELLVNGDGPFTVNLSCFVSKPPPPGFRGCPQCVVHTIAANQAMQVVADKKFWADKEGQIGIEVSDRNGHSVVLKVGVLPAASQEQSFATANA